MHFSTPLLATSPDPQLRAPAHSLERRRLHFSNSASHLCTSKPKFQQIPKTPNKFSFVDPFQCCFCVLHTVGSTTGTAIGFDPSIDISRTEWKRYRYIDQARTPIDLAGERWEVLDPVRFGGRCEYGSSETSTCPTARRSTFATRTRAHRTMGTTQSGAMRTTWPPNHVDGKNVKMATFAGGCVRNANRTKGLRMRSYRQRCGHRTNEHVLTSNDGGNALGVSGDSSWRTNGNQACCKRAWDTPKDTSNDRRIDKCAAEGQDTPKPCS